VFVRGETLSVHSASPRKIPGWIVLVREKFSVNKWAYEILLSRFLSVFFFKFYIWISQLSSTKVENDSMCVLNWHAKENLVVNNKNNTVFMSRNYRSGSCPLEI